MAAPSLPDPNFETTVVLLLEHSDEGALGVVLNRPSDVALRSALGGWEPYAAEPPVVFIGGPVEQDAILGLAAVSGEVEGVRPVAGGIGLVELQRGPEVLEPSGTIRIFAGYAGWGPGQLETEIEEGTWFIVGARPEDVVSDDPDGLWRGVLARQGGVFATVTDDPGLN